MSLRLRAETPLHLGSSRPGLEVDMELVRDGRGRLVLPGTSLAGCLRAALRRTGELGDHPWWGDHEHSASRITVDDAVQTAGTDAPIMIRPGVSIDRRTGAARDHFLYDRELVMPGATFEFRMTIDAEPHVGESDPGIQIRDAVVTLLRDSGIDIGGGSRRGLGRVRVAPTDPNANSGSRWWVEDRSTRAGLTEVLRRKRDAPPAASTEVVAPGNATPAPGTLQISVAWKPVHAVMSTVAIVGAAVQTIPATSADPGASTRLRFVLPGTSIAGALASQIERIARTLRADPELDRRELTGAASLLGLALRHSVDAHGTRTREGAASALQVDDCLSSSSFPTDDWINSLTGEELVAQANEIREATRSPGDSRDKVSIDSHTAIDRWTGGAVDTALYTEVTPSHLVEWDPLKLAVDVDLLGEGDSALAGWALLLLCLRDLCQGRLALGGRVTRGLGSVRVDPAHVTFAAAPGLLEDSIGARLAGHGTLVSALADTALVRELSEVLDRTHPKPVAA